MLARLFKAIRIDKWFYLAVSASFLLLLTVTYVFLLETAGISSISLAYFEPGRVADQDIRVPIEIQYIDQAATETRKKSYAKLVPPVFKYDADLSSQMLKTFLEFTAFLSTAQTAEKNADNFLQEIRTQYPDILDDTVIKNLYSEDELLGLVSYAITIFKQIADQGVAVFPQSEISSYNPDKITILKQTDHNKNFISVDRSFVITQATLPDRIKTDLLPQNAEKYADILVLLIMPFLSDTLVFDAAESELRMQAALSQVPPVTTVLKKNQKIIQRGFIVTNEQYEQLQILSDYGRSIDFRMFSAVALFLVLIFLLSLFLFSKKIIGQTVQQKYRLLILLFFNLVYILVFFTARIKFFNVSFDVVMIMPVAFFAMLISVLSSQRVAVFSTTLFAFAVLVAANFSAAAALFALFTGLIAAGLTRFTGKRIDLVIIASVLGFSQCIILLLLTLAFPDLTVNLTVLSFAVAVNGFLSGIFVLGFLPILETILNTPTVFRLMELSDLNVPIMKKMLLTVPGTYNHSMMVATLAENGCRAIGANSLLVRVAAYYHDIGKMDQGEYFVENQKGGHNKLNDLNPRLAATVIRSHVKIGIEKARQLRLPQEVIDLIAEHHGNSLIVYFYEKAKKEDPSVDPEDFTYPGPPPQTRESAVLMLADVVEAACHTLEKPTVPRLEKFIDMLVEKKIEMHQLHDSNITLRDLKTIKAVFVTILAGYYHSRIEYPNQKDPDDVNTKPLESAV